MKNPVLLLCIFWCTLFAADKTASHFRVTDFKNSEFHADIEVNLSDGSRVFLDQTLRELALIFPDGRIKFSGGFGLGPRNLTDPVALVSDGISIFVCDRAGNRIVQFNRLLDFKGSAAIQSSPDSKPFYPDNFAVNSIEQMVVFSEESNEVWLKDPSDIFWIPILDLKNQSIPIKCVDEIHFSGNNRIVLTDECGNTEYTFSIFGRLIHGRKIIQE